MAVPSAGLTWGCAMVISNVALMPLDRIIYGTRVVLAGEEQPFRRPFFLEFVMFLAMAACLLLEVPGWRRRRRDGPARFWPSPWVQLKLVLPALCDLIGSWFIFCGALWVPASIVEMLSSSNTIFTALLSICFLKKRMARHELAGILLSVLGVLVVGVAQMQGPSAGNAENGGNGDSSSIALGMLLVVIAHLWYAFEFVVTEKIFGESDVSAFMSVGTMGVWGVLLFVPLFVLLRFTPTSPEAYAPLWHEDVGDSLAALQGKPGLLAAVAAIFFALILFNAAAFKTTELLSAMARVVLGSTVSPLVWALDLLLAAVTNGRTGAAEHLSAWSSLQLLGFVFILSGSFVYNAVGPCRRLASAAGTDAGSISQSESLVAQVELVFHSRYGGIQGNAAIKPQLEADLFLTPATLAPEARSDMQSNALHA
eukprot:CAMPEP_0117514146 /NCGR_PEP_ID=MMETSP0784-20121206/29920_1 /TAXON_ID=39447 /ORGANISM="" /LENGTH=424 /DNA_ID=CAMNT_0005309935 /DNA_START=84 /DNA_END=1359 /DNA_ORIENTATION=-